MKTNKKDKEEVEAILAFMKSGKNLRISSDDEQCYIMFKNKEYTFQLSNYYRAEIVHNICNCDDVLIADIKDMIYKAQYIDYKLSKLTQSEKNIVTNITSNESFNFKYKVYLLVDRLKSL